MVMALAGGIITSTHVVFLHGFRAPDSTMSMKKLTAWFVDVLGCFSRKWTLGFSHVIMRVRTTPAKGSVELTRSTQQS
jgi:hypothetical protein